MTPRLLAYVTGQTEVKVEGNDVLHMLIWGFQDIRWLCCGDSIKCVGRCVEYVEGITKEKKWTGRREAGGNKLEII